MLRRAQIQALDIIQPADGTLPEDCWDETSYNLRLGRQFVVIADQKHEISDSSAFGIQIPSLGCVLVSTDEWLKMPSGVYGRWGLRIRHALSGLVFQAGPQIEPSYQGRLFGLLFNLSTAKRHLRYRESIWSIDFTSLGKLPTKPAEKFTDEDIKFDITDYATYDMPTGSIADHLERLHLEFNAYRQEVSAQADSLRQQRDELFGTIITESKQNVAEARSRERERADLRSALYLGGALVLVCTAISTAVPTIVSKMMYDRDEFVELLDRKNELNEQAAFIARMLKDMEAKGAEHVSRDKRLEEQLLELRSLLSAAGQAPKPE